MISFLGRLVRLPIALVGHFLEGFGRATLSMERIAGQTFERAVRQGFEAFLGAPLDEGPGPWTLPPETPTPRPEPPPPNSPGPSLFALNNLGVPSERTLLPSEKRTMADTNLNDDMVKLVEYAIVTIERRKEKIVDKAIDRDGKLGHPLLYLETDRITGDGFSNARIADWVKDNPDEANRVDLDSLRVYYSVVARWPRSALKYEEEMLDIEDKKLEYLRDIRDGKR